MVDLAPTSRNFSANVDINDPQILTAKVVVLGDPGTGKSSLIKSLKESGRIFESRNVEDDIFSLILFDDADLHTKVVTAAGTLLKVKEFSGNWTGQPEEEMACKGALFCIITFDITNLDSAHSALHKWVSVKELIMPESFLFVVGTFLDEDMNRRVETAKICKACAQKDAVYMEVTANNGQYGMNISLLRKLLVQKLSYMIQRRAVIGEATVIAVEAADNIVDSANEANIDGHEGMASGEVKESNSSDNDNENRVPQLFTDPSSEHLGSLRVPYLERHVLRDSVGSILASTLGRELWRGFKAEEEVLQDIGADIAAFIEKIDTDPTLATAVPNHVVASHVAMQHSHALHAAHGGRFPTPASGVGSTHAGGGGSNPQTIGVSASAMTSESVDGASNAAKLIAATSSSSVIEDFVELQKAYRIMGLSLPSSLVPPEIARDNHSMLDPSGMINVAVDLQWDHTSWEGNTGSFEYEIGNGQLSLSNLRKMVVRMLSGNVAEMIIDLDAMDLDQQIELFMLSHTFSTQQEAETSRMKLLDFVHKLQREYLAETSALPYLPSGGSLSVEGTVKSLSSSPVVLSGGKINARNNVSESSSSPVNGESQENSKNGEVKESTRNSPHPREITHNNEDRQNVVTSASSPNKRTTSSRLSNAALESSIQTSPQTEEAASAASRSSNHQIPSNRSNSHQSHTHQSSNIGHLSSPASLLNSSPSSNGRASGTLPPSPLTPFTPPPVETLKKAGGANITPPSSSMTRNNSSSFIAHKKCRLRLVLPSRGRNNTTGSAVTEMVDVIFEAGDNLQEVAERIATAHGLSPQAHQKLLNQLVQSLLPPPPPIY